MDSGTSSGGSSTSGGTDSGVVADAVFGTDAFVPGQPGSQDSTQGAGHPGAGSPGATGVDCMTCHKTGGTGAANIWLAAGTVYKGTTPAPQGVEVRIVDKDGKKVGVSYTDASGNFAFDNGALPQGIPTGAMVGVRDGDGAAKISDMPTTSGAVVGECASAACHSAAQHITVN